MTRSLTVEIAPRPGLGHLPDATLLDRFLARRDERAFEELVRRHGAGVLRVCRRRLGEGQDAEDACQATFLVLIRRADAIRRVDDVGVWLRGVARRVAGRSRMRADRERVRKGAGVDVGDLAGPEEAGPDDLGPALRAEVERLPEKYRRPIELCYWEGLSNDQAAERLECPTGTVKWRLSRARELLRDRVARRGIALSALLLGRRHLASGPLTGSPTESGPGPTRGGQDPEGSVLSDEFVRGTVELAVFARDSSSPLLGIGGGGRRASLTGRRGRYSIKLVPLIAILATISLPALAITLGLQTTAEAREVPGPSKGWGVAFRGAVRHLLFGDPPKHHCGGASAERL